MVVDHQDCKQTKEGRKEGRKEKGRKEGMTHEILQ
jgi:hypothetical protein